LRISHRLPDRLSGPEFTKYQQHAIGVRDLAIQLFEVHKYKNGLLVFNEIKPSDRRESIISVAKSNPLAKRVSEEIKVYSEDDLLHTADDKVKELYSQLKSGVIMLGTDIELRPTKKYIGFIRRQGYHCATVKVEGAHSKPASRSINHHKKG